MKTRVLRTALGSLICLALLAVFSTSGAQAPTPPTPPIGSKWLASDPTWVAQAGPLSTTSLAPTVTSIALASGINTGSATSWDATGEAAATSHDQVRASHPGSGSDWSLVQSVGLQPPSTLLSSGDSCILEGYPGTNAGSAADMWVGYDDYLDPDGEIVRSLIQFDLSAIPTGTSIDTATLQVYLVASWDFPDETRTITTYRISSAWSESSVTWNARPSYAGSYGSAPVTHGAWGWYSFDVTNLVRGWVGGSLANYGVMLRGPEWSGSDSSWKSFSTREGPHTPTLVISYTATSPAPTVTGITPSSGINTGTVHITNLAGSNFQSGATVKLTRSGQADINATSVTVVSGSQITCDFDLTGATAGQWNVVVTNPDSQSGQLDNGFTVKNPVVYLPLVTRCWPLAAYLQPIDNPDGDGVYTVGWSWPSCAPSPSYYQLQSDNDSQFGSPETFTRSDTAFDAYSPTPGSYYWRVRANLSGTGWSAWSNIQSVTVTDRFAYVWVDNDTGGNLTVEIVGIEKKSFSTGYHYWRSIPPGRYTYKASARCGSGTWTDDFVAGENVLSFWCGYSAVSTSVTMLGEHDVRWSPVIRDVSSMR